MLQVKQCTIIENANQDLVYKALATLAIERSLLKIGQPIYDKVVSVLNERYQCHVPNCYDNPEYLSEALKEIFGNAYHVVVNEIRKELIEFSYKTQIIQFMKAI